MLLEQEKTRLPKPPKKPAKNQDNGTRASSHRKWLAFSIVLLLIIAIETGIIIAQSQANRRIEAQSAQALGKFLKSGEQASTGVGTDLLLQNVRFCWSKQVCVNTSRLSAHAVPLDRKSPVNFDDLTGFMVNVRNATVEISPKTLQGMFNESVFNYPGSNLRGLSVDIDRAGAQNHVRVGGSLKYLFLWIPFEMDTNLSVDSKSNTLVIAVNTLRVFGVIPATWLIDLKPFNLEKLLTLPPNNHLIVHRNLMMVKPFGLFPPPRVNGKISGISVTPKLISLSFSGAEQAFQPLPDATARNYIYLENGSTRFGRLGMINTQIEVIDQNPANLFQFSLLNYQADLPNSSVQLQPNGSVKVVMPDQDNLAEPATKKAPKASTPVQRETQTAQSGKKKPEAENTKTVVDKAKNGVHNTTEKIKNTLGL